MKIQQWLFLLLGIWMLAGCATGMNKPYNYPPKPDLGPLAKAVYMTVMSSANDFSVFETASASSERIDAHIERMGNAIRYDLMPADMRRSAFSSYRQDAEYRVPEIEPLFSEVAVVPQEPLLVKGVRLSDHQIQHELVYRLPYDTRARAKQAADRIAGALRQSIMSRADGWTWRDKKEQMREFMLGMSEILAGSEQALDTYIQKQKKHQAAGRFDRIVASYQWHPGRADINTRRLTTLSMAYTDNGLEVSVVRIRPDQPQAR